MQLHVLQPFSSLILNSAYDHGKGRRGGITLKGLLASTLDVFEGPATRTNRFILQQPILVRWSLESVWTRPSLVTWCLVWKLGKDVSEKPTSIFILPGILGFPYYNYQHPAQCYIHTIRRGQSGTQLTTNDCVPFGTQFAFDNETIRIPEISPTQCGFRLSLKGHNLATEYSLRNDCLTSPR